MSPQETITFSPAVDERQLDREVGQIDDQLAEVGQDVPVEFDPDDVEMDGLGGGGAAAAARGSGGLGAGGAAGVGALASKIPKPVSGVTAASALPIALAGGVGLGMLSAMRGASGRLQTTASLLGTATDIFFRPFGNALDKLIRPMALGLMDFAQDFSALASDQGLGVAVASLAPQAAGAIGNAFGNIISGQGGLGDFLLAGTSAVTVAKLLTGASITSLLTPASITSLVTTAGISSVFTSASISGLLSGASIGSFLTTASASTLFATASITTVFSAVAATALIEEVTLSDLITQPGQDVGLSVDSATVSARGSMGVAARRGDIEVDGQNATLNFPSVDEIFSDGGGGDGDGLPPGGAGGGPGPGGPGGPPSGDSDGGGTVDSGFSGGGDDPFSGSNTIGEPPGRGGGPRRAGIGGAADEEFDTVSEFRDALDSITSGFQSGGTVRNTGVAKVHRGEIISQPDDLVDELARAIRGTTGGSSGADMSAVERKLDQLNRNVSRLASAMQSMELRTDSETIGRVATEGKRQRIADRDPTV